MSNNRRKINVGTKQAGKLTRQDSSEKPCQTRGAEQDRLQARSTFWNMEVLHTLWGIFPKCLHLSWRSPAVVGGSIIHMGRSRGTPAHLLHARTATLPGGIECLHTFLSHALGGNQLQMRVLPERYPSTQPGSSVSHGGTYKGISTLFKCYTVPDYAPELTPFQTDRVMREKNTTTLACS